MSQQKNEHGLKYNTIIIAISNLGSRAISFILAPIYSFYMNPEQYGTMDLISTTVVLIFPFVCIDVFEAAFRFASDNKYDKKKVLTNTGIIGIVAEVTILLLYSLLSFFFKFPSVIFICLVTATLDSIFYVMAEFARGSGKMITFALSGILSSVAMLLMNILFLIVLSKGLTGWIISLILEKVVAIFYLSISIKAWRLFSFKSIDKVFIKEILKYCIPLMPSASMWWVMNASDRYVISFFAGMAATGIYAVANKLPAILSVFENVFYQAWQTSAIRIKDTENRDDLFSSVFTKYFSFLSVGVVSILVILKPLITHLFAKDYHAAWISAPVLLFAVMIHALGGNLGTLYTVYKNTVGALKTSTIGAISNIVLNIIFVKLYGYTAAAWTTLVSYFVVLFMRWIDSRKFIHLRINKKDLFLGVGFIGIQMALYFVPGYVALSIRAVIALIYILMNWKLLWSLVKK